MHGGAAAGIGGSMKLRRRKSRIGNRWIALAALIAAAAGTIAFAPIGAAQAPADQFEFNSRNIATFTAAQAAQGKDAYAKNCASCHGTNLGGSEFASSLRGATFSLNWGGQNAAALFTFIATKMPPASPARSAPTPTRSSSHLFCKPTACSRAKRSCPLTRNALPR